MISVYRWRLLSGWILVFSVAVVVALVAGRRETSARKTERDQQIQRIVNEGNRECVRAFGAMTALLRLSIPPDRVKDLNKTQAAVVQQLFDLVDPDLNCRRFSVATNTVGPTGRSGPTGDRGPAGTAEPVG